MFATTTPLMDVSANVSSNLTILRRFSDWHIQRNWLKNFFKFQYKHLSKDFPKQVFFWYFNYFSLFSLYLCWYNLTYSDQFCWNSCLHWIDTEISQWQPGTHIMSSVGIFTLLLTEVINHLWCAAQFGTICSI